MKYLTYNEFNFRKISQLQKASEEKKFEIDVVSKVQPFKTNNYVVNELIDWEDFENDPIFIMNFPNKHMLSRSHFDILAGMLRKNSDRKSIRGLAEKIWEDLNPHPAGQMNLNIPVMDGVKLSGLQHKYEETVLFFPTQGQTCHAYCTFCFRWPQFIGISQLKFVMKESMLLIKYLRKNKHITDLLITGGDPMVMTARHLAEYINAVLDADISHLKTIRIGTKSLSYWPYRFVSDPDSKDVLRLFEKVVKSGRHLAIMANFNHPVELSTDIVHKAIKNIRQTGATIRSQSPLLNHINANDNIWAKLWKDQVSLGIIPYYMFIPRDTGARSYFGLPLYEAWQIFRKAFSHISGLCRTVRGPVMSCGPGKIHISGVSEIKNEKVFVLNFLQSRNPKWTGRPFFAGYDEQAYWLDELTPAFGQKEFFFENQYRRFIEENLNLQQINMDDPDGLSMCS